MVYFMSNGTYGDRQEREVRKRVPRRRTTLREGKRAREWGPIEDENLGRVDRLRTPVLNPL